MSTPPLPHPRREYGTGELREADVDGSDPLSEVRRWVDEAIAAGVHEPTACTLATVDAAGVPDARVVLVREVDDRGLTWFTSLASSKGRQLADRPVAAVVLFWPDLERQVRVRGRVEDVPAAVSDAYFASRPRPSQVSAWASSQSEPVADRATLEAAAAAAEERFADGAPVPRPASWGGQLLRPDEVELWQGRQARLHDRLRWTRTAEGWQLDRLQP
ncbi:MAG: pyridoxamine 5'-phosphate oxidase [Nitriliruptor sp.]|uniref:pyridoxamine 5'-phosphate oxidase n=1 Tax=Nitriliruptor sp. TaxID=2448056 RepID=UPI00349FE452